uniref:Dystrophin n=1 Tax=Vespula pensylvanica TaxID=30213 RepID=A0A834NQ67_VESPE|nr:hypothetical protein H0235_012094 [Vespula pensylvanica]
MGRSDETDACGWTVGSVLRSAFPAARSPAVRVWTASRVSLTKLREHWDETNSKVMQRKTQLDAMLGDSQRYEAKRNEVEVWLARMETRLERMRAVGHTADVLEAQLREQKSFHAELHQYKHHIELFNQLTQKLIAVYQQDDTTRVKKMTETINQRYNNLNTSIINRGKLLHSAMNSLHNFDRSLDKFLAWLSEAESSMEGLEAEADRLGGRRDQGALRRPQHQLKVRHGPVAGFDAKMPLFRLLLVPFRIIGTAMPLGSIYTESGLSSSVGARTRGLRLA